MSLAEEALCYKCPDCGVSSGQPCVYMADGFKSGYDWTTGQTSRRQTQVKGAPTRRPHNGRVRKAAAARRAVELAAWRTEQAHKLRDRFSDERAAYAAMARREQQDLILWLKKFGSVLWTT